MMAYAFEKESNISKKYLDIVDVIIVVIGADERVELLNRKGCELTGYSEAEAIGRNWFDTFIPTWEREDSRALFQSLAAGETIQAEFYENRILTRSGEEKLISWHNSVLHDKEGRFIGTLNSGTDITRQREAEKHYLELFESADEGIFQTTPDGRFLHVNPAFADMLGYKSPQEMIRSATTANIYADQKKRALVSRAFETRGSIKGYELQLVRRDGNKIWVSVNARTIWDSRGKVSYYEGMAEDITKRKQAEKDLRKTLRLLRKAMEGSIYAVAMTVEAKDPYTAGHQQHVADLSRAMAEKIGLSRSEREGIYLAGMIHDLGKISVPTEFLAKPGKLTEFEYSLIKTHPDAGYRILKDIEFPWPVAEIIRQHHERIDGSGYPRGLRGEEILQETKIISIADVVEAMAFHRPYRAGFGMKHALGEIKRNKGRLYDSHAADICLELFEKSEFVWGKSGIHADGVVLV